MKTTLIPLDLTDGLYREMDIIPKKGFVIIGIRLFTNGRGKEPEKFAFALEPDQIEQSIYAAAKVARKMTHD